MGADISLAAAMMLAALAAWDGFWQYVADEALTALLRPVPVRAATVAVDHVATELRQDAGRTLLTVRGVGVSGAVRGQRWDWRVGEVVVELPTGDASRLAVILPAPQRFAADGPLGRTAVTVWAENLGATLALTGDGTVRAVNLSGDGVTIEAAGVEARAARLDLTLERRGEADALDFVLAEVTVPESLRLGPPLGGRIERATLRGRVAGLRPLPPTAAAWRAASGLVGISELRVLWGPVDLRLDGEVGLDEGLRPAGEARVALGGVENALAALHAAGLGSDAWQVAMRRALARMHDDGASDLAFSVSVAGGVLRWSGLPLAIVPAFTAPATGCAESAEAPAC